MIAVGHGPIRLFRAEVKVSSREGQTVLHVIPGGISLLLRLVNRFWIARKVAQVLQAAPALH
jgi:hypothetical protein